YKELAKEGDILNSLVLNRQDIGERVKKLGSLNNRINSLKTEVEKLNADVESLVKERDKKIKEFKEKVISLNSVVLSSSAGLVVFATDSKESLRSSIIEGKMESLGKNFNYILGKPKITSDGDMVKKGEPLGKIIDNLEQFAILYVVPDGVAGLPHNNLDIYIGDGPVSLELLKWIKEGSNEIWFCTVRDKRYIESSYFSLDVKIGDIEGMVVPRELIKEENNKSYILILNKDSIEKRIVKILGGNRERVVLDNIKEGEILVRN
ncbi:MAG TPA: HlyD family efflux transporter periplasmic adaptor subunit, partial [bacterium]|nr:HlyD family efflux transporter periplasmic adaptor subunit [bacterium]